MIVNLRTAALLALIGGLSPCAFAGPSFVGNGDGGADLEGSAPLTSGPIADARGKAADLLRRLNVPGVSGLGLLLPEVESSPLFLAQGDREPTQRDDQGAFHSDMRGLVFARTFAHPHAATRFFPVALGLSENQLVALHIHEGLHRALPSSIAEDEAKVTALTLAITSPNATFDQVQAVASREIPSPAVASGPAPAALTPATAAPATAVATAPATAVAPVAPTGAGESVSSGSTRTPIELSYSYIALRDYVSYPGELAAISSLQKIEVKASPFHDRLPLTLGAAAVLAATSQDGSFGPVQLSAALRLLDPATSGMELQVWGRSTLTFLAGSTYLQSGVGRNVTSGGFTGRWNTGRFEIEDSLYSTSGGSADFGTAPSGDQISQTGYGTTNFGSSYHEKLSLTRVYDHLRLGAFAQASLGSVYAYYLGPPAGNYSEVSPPTYSNGGNQFILSLGPQISWVDHAFAVSLDGDFICPGTHGSFDAFGDILDQGTGNTVVTAKLALFF